MYNLYISYLLSKSLKNYIMEISVFKGVFIPFYSLQKDDHLNRDLKTNVSVFFNYIGWGEDIGF